MATYDGTSPVSQEEQQHEFMIMESTLARIPPVFLEQMKSDAGVSNRDLSTLSYEEKTRLNAVLKRTMGVFMNNKALNEDQRKYSPQEQQEIMALESNLARIPPVFLAQMKMEAGLVAERDISTMSFEEKSRLNTAFNKIMATYNKTSSPSN